MNKTSKNEKKLIEDVKSYISYTAKYKPSLLAIMIFGSIITVITMLLCLPISTVDGKMPNFVDALFTATSSVCVTGLTTVETATYWSHFGHFVIALGMKIGGLGVMTFASILALAVSKNIGLTQRLIIANENQIEKLGKVKTLIRAVIIISATCEFLLFLALFPHFYYGVGYSFVKSIGYGLFMSVSIFNNSGFVIMPEGMEVFANDIFVIAPIIIGTFAGAIGFPVILNITSNIKNPRAWNIHTKLTVITYLILFVIGTVLIGLLEWNNTHTLGNLPLHSKISNSLLLGINGRSSGLSTLDIGQMHPSTWLVQDVLMFIGGGSASTAGGIKVTTLAVLTLAIVAEARGDTDIQVFGRRIPNTTVRLAVTVIAIGSFLVFTSIFLLLLITNLSLDVIAFEVISAFATVGLSTGITPLLPTAGKYLLVLLMFAGRIGTMTVTAALALRKQKRVLRYPEEKPAIG
ncbi:TrkH family potassium uptake protein [Actinomyces sp. zg-332]|uniref:TrkH family potassium uptake protein n=1 Tax=Actinomyces sp. zg-332 TaxID=2708340 RepID=UPI001421176B|nr:potassium transporter TrkG [Actinomyces sp. zg-332]QPK94042.1 TrkH family potassium uptake protein [Actinomyces sp. zg-332]